MEIIKNVTASILGTHKADNYTDIVADLINPTKRWGVICF